jgi:hypothetical protein
MRPPYKVYPQPFPNSEDQRRSSLPAMERPGAIISRPDM